jgi:hypothetical protein
LVIFIFKTRRVGAGFSFDFEMQVTSKIEFELLFVFEKLFIIKNISQAKFSLSGTSSSSSSS